MFGRFLLFVEISTTVFSSKDSMDAASSFVGVSGNIKCNEELLKCNIICDEFQTCNDVALNFPFGKNICEINCLHPSTCNNIIINGNNCKNILFNSKYDHKNNTFNINNTSELFLNNNNNNNNEIIYSNFLINLYNKENKLFIGNNINFKSNNIECFDKNCLINFNSNSKSINNTFYVNKVW